MRKYRLAASAAVLVLVAGIDPARLLAAAADYRFELAGPPIKSGEKTLVNVRLLHVPDSRPVAGAIVIRTRFDMSPDGMATMTAPAQASTGSEPGLYRIEAQPSAAGHWALILAAKVPGEPETVRGTVTVAIAK
ncbi:MAG TPA: FixH family protein [Stellaceae bacterium]|nr:FixH family protein [Stellaceae bacterium]